MNDLTNSKYKSNILRITIVATLGGFLFGYDTGVIGGTQLYFTEYFSLSSGEQGWAVSSALYGSLVGAMIAGYLSSKISRKYTLILSAVLFTISAFGSGIAMTLTELVLYRIIGGLGIGMASMTAPMYIAEMAPPKDRGRLVSYYQLAVVLGFFIVFLATYFIGSGDTAGLSAEEITVIHDHNLDRGWRVMFWSELLPAGAFLVLLFFVPHSPRWLMLKGREEDAKLVLDKITPNNAEAQSEFDEIKDSFVKAKEHHTATIFAAGMGFVLFIGIMLSVFQQITGINAILYYGAEIFSNALGYGPEDALKQQVWLGAVNLIFTFVAIYTVDSWGRKPLLITGTIGMAVGLSVLGISIYTGQLGIVSLVAILVFVGSFALSMGPIVWVMLAEIFPNKIRSVGMSIAVAAQWLFNGIVANTFPLINNSEMNQVTYNGALPYFIFAFFCLVTIIFVVKFIPETKGKSLEEMENLWVKEED